MGKARKLAAAGLLVMGVKVAAVCGAGAVVSSWVDDIVSSGRMVTWKWLDSGCSRNSIICCTPGVVETSLPSSTCQPWVTGWGV